MTFPVVVLLSILSGCGGGSSNPAPVAITEQPQSTSVIAGTGALFSVTAAGDGLTYQWQRAASGTTTWAAVAAATEASYSIASTAAAMSGDQYRVVVVGTAGTLTSSAATLTVTAAPAAPTIVTDPASQQALVGANVSFFVTATGTSLTYGWQSSVDGGSTWADVAGATTATLTLTPVALTDNGKRLRAVVGNAVGSVDSAAAALTVMQVPLAPQISTQPVAASVVAPQTATFTVVATGTPVPSYQWQVSADSGANYSDVAGALSASYTTPVTTAADSGKLFRVQVSNAVGTVSSTAAVLSVTPAAMAPTITAQPVNQSVSAPMTAAFTVAASGTPTPTYQWQLSTDGGGTFANINGATSASYTTPATTIADGGKQFRTVVSNSAGSVNSAVATLTVSGASSPVGDASACTDPASLHTGSTYHEVMSSPGVAGIPGDQTTDDGIVIGPAIFHGQSAVETQVTSVTTGVGATINQVTMLYINYDLSTNLLTVYGSTAHISTTTGGQTNVTDIDGQFTPPFVDASHSLLQGQSVMQTNTLTATETITVNGVAHAPVTAATTGTDTVTFAGIESLTVPAGTFPACRFEHSMVSPTNSTPSLSTVWLHVGDGIALQTAAAGVVNSQAISFSVTIAP